MTVVGVGPGVWRLPGVGWRGLVLKQTLGPTWLSTPTEKINAMTTASFGMPQLVAKACEARVFAWAPSGRKHGNASEGRSEGRVLQDCVQVTGNGGVLTLFLGGAPIPVQSSKVTKALFLWTR